MVAYQIAVVGAGLAGLAMATALQQRGHTVSVFEERHDTSSGAGISIWPNALAALDEMGLGDAVRASGGQVAAGAMRWRDGTWLRRPSAQRMVRALGEPLVVTRRCVLRDILAGALRPGTVHYGQGVSGLAVDDRVTVRLADSTTLLADAVIGADGTNSTVASHLNGPLRQHYAGYTAWRGVADIGDVERPRRFQLLARISGHRDRNIDEAFRAATRRDHDFALALR